MQRLLVVTLRQFYHCILTADQFEDGRELLKHEPVDLIVINTTARRNLCSCDPIVELQSNPHLYHVPILVIGEYPGPPPVQTCQRAGAPIAFLPKPFTYQEIRTLLTCVIIPMGPVI